MNNQASYLVVQNGTAEAEAAAEFAWELAKENLAKLDVQYVIDTPAIWHFLSFSVPGFVGSGPFVEAQKKITETFRSLAETFVVSYSSQANGKEIKSDCYIDEGDPIVEVCRRAANYDLVIIGQSSDIENPQTSLLISKLEELCPKPVVIVQLTTAMLNGKRRLLILNSAANQEASEAVFELGRKMAASNPEYEVEESLKYSCLG